MVIVRMQQNSVPIVFRNVKGIAITAPKWRMGQLYSGAKTNRAEELLLQELVLQEGRFQEELSKDSVIIFIAM